MTQIEKIARLMGCEKVDDMGFIRIHPDGSRGAWFDPLTNKGDLMDVECALEIDVEWQHTDGYLSAKWWDFKDVFASGRVYLKDHPDKFTARATAVLNVAEQIYDHRTEGK